VLNYAQRDAPTHSINFLGAIQGRTITVRRAIVPDLPRYAVKLRFASDDDREVLVPLLRELGPGVSMTEDEDSARIVFDDVESPVAALVRAQMLVHEACAGTGVAPASVRRSPSQ
jgi:hypothetical protein